MCCSFSSQRLVTAEMSRAHHAAHKDEEIGLHRQPESLSDTAALTQNGTKKIKVQSCAGVIQHLENEA